MFQRPIFIVGPPRSEVSLLLKTLRQSPDVATLDRSLDDLESIGNAANGSHRLLAASSLRVPTLRAAFPDARFVFLYREPREDATQWASATSLLLDDLEHLPAVEWCVVNYERLVS